LQKERQNQGEFNRNAIQEYNNTGTEIDLNNMKRRGKECKNSPHTWRKHRARPVPIPLLWITTSTTEMITEKKRQISLDK